MPYALNIEVQPYKYNAEAKNAKICFFNPEYSALQQTALQKSMVGITTPMDYYCGHGLRLALRRC